MWLAILMVVISLLILLAGGESLVKGAASISRRAGISPLVIGLTVVAFGTSAPELTVNMIAAFNGNADIAIGNIVGSNTANILLILGICALVFPLAVKKGTVWKEIPFALLAMILVYTMGNDALFDGTGFNAITRTDGFSLIAVFVIFMFYTFGLAQASGNAEDVKAYSWSKSILFTVVGLGLLFLGGKILVDNATILAKLAGLSEIMIGLTIVAVGTSLPELVTSLVATYRHHDDIAIGNIVGSNIFNVFWILGLTGTILQLPFNPSTNIDVLVCIGATALLFAFMFIGRLRKLDRWQGAIFLMLYIIYIAYLVQRS